MAFIDCLKGKVEEGLLTESQLKKFEDTYNRINQNYRKNMSDPDAATAAAQKLIEIEADFMARKKKNTINNALEQKRVLAELRDLEKKGTSFATGVRDLLERAHFRGQTAFKRGLNDLDNFVEEFRSKFAGLTRRKDGITDVVREMLGQNTGNEEARVFAQGLRKAFDRIHEDYINAGGVIGTLNNYFPQVHTARLIKQVDVEEWVEFTFARLDRSKMFDQNTGIPFNDKELKAMLRNDYQSIITNGQSDLKKMADEGEMSYGVGAEISAKRQDHRFYHFNDADSFMEYNARFGVTDDGLFDAIIDTLQMKSRDTGILEIMGPKPNAMMRMLDFQMTARNVGANERKWTKGMYDTLTGFTSGTASDHWAFRQIGNLRNLFSSAYLGSAPISAIADTAFISQTAKLNGLSSTKALGRYLKLMNPASAGDRQIAKRSGYIAEISHSGALNDLRFTGDNFGGKATSWLAAFTNRASGLHAMTKAAADAVSLEMEGTLADLVRAKKGWGQLDKRFRSNLETAGMTKKDWEILSNTPLFEPEKGIFFLSSREVAKLNIDGALDTANKLQDMIFELRAIATNEPQLRTRSITTGAAFADDARAGTFVRNFAASTFQFKSFPITVMFNHLLPIFQKNTKGDRMVRIGHTIVATTVLGAAAQQLREVAKGKDTRDMTDFKFWTASMMQGGGLGFFGDFLFSDHSRYGTTLLPSIGGPLGGFLEQGVNTFKGNLDRFVDDKEGVTWDKFKRDTFRLARRNVPAQNLWYSRLLLERFVFDQIEMAIDSDFERRTARLERRMEKETGQKTYWQRGRLYPSRPPKVAEAPE